MLCSKIGSLKTLNIMMVCKLQNAERSKKTHVGPRYECSKKKVYLHASPGVPSANGQPWFHGGLEAGSIAGFLFRPLFGTQPLKGYPKMFLPKDFLSSGVPHIAAASRTVEFKHVPVT